MVDNIRTTNEPLICQTLNSNGRLYNNHNMNHSSVNPSTVMVDIITTNNMNHSSVKPYTVMIENIATTTT
jgi:hypothetical protein